jgi:hypothetical protein
MFGDGSLTFQEFATREPVPLARVHDAVLEFLRGRTDMVLCGAHAVNAYVDQARMTDDVDLVAIEATELAKELCGHLGKRLRMTLKTRRVGLTCEICQSRGAKKRRLVDIRVVEELPPVKRVKEVLVLAPPELIACKVIRMMRRKHGPHAGIDQADLCRLLLKFPALKSLTGAVADRLRAHGARTDVFAAWKKLVAQEILAEHDDDKFAW